MNSSTLRRLASDHASLHNSGLPPNYLFPPQAASSNSDDLTQLTILLTGSQGTPYTQGLWRLNLKIPDDYPKSPPKAAFKTRIWHPNVEESTGSVCVDTLKKDWESKLTLRDILTTISCLLIHPNPDSALNAAAGQLLQDDYESFARQAKLMTSIHAQIPNGMKDAVREARRRGDDKTREIPEDREERPAGPRTTSSSSSVVMKKRPGPSPLNPSAPTSRSNTGSEIGINLGLGPIDTENQRSTSVQEADDESDDENDATTASKENDPSLSPSPVSPAPPSPRRNVLGKRPLASLPTPLDPDLSDNEDEDNDLVSPSEQNIANNTSRTPQLSQHFNGPLRKSPKLSELSKGVNASGRIRDDVQIYEDSNIGEGKENFASGGEKPMRVVKKSASNGNGATGSAGAPKAVATRKVSTASSSSGKSKVKAGLRRL